MPVIKRRRTTRMPSSISHTEEWRAGYRAGRAGRSYSSNPWDQRILYQKSSWKSGYFPEDLRYMRTRMGTAVNMWHPSYHGEYWTAGWLEGSGRVNPVKVYYMGERVCSKCKKPGPFSGKDAYCKKCRRDYNQAYAEKKREAQQMPDFDALEAPAVERVLFKPARGVTVYPHPTFVEY